MIPQPLSKRIRHRHNCPSTERYLPGKCDCPATKHRKEAAKLEARVQELEAALRDILTCIEYPHHHAGAEYVNVICVTCKDVARAALDTAQPVTRTSKDTCPASDRALTDAEPINHVAQWEDEGGAIVHAPTDEGEK